jgi:hypothetical protein
VVRVFGLLQDISDERRIGYESRHDEGTAFWIELPLTKKQNQRHGNLC